tara:strand:+ start:2913 stop:3047 length:135 start_codon:yes stop_codon:yes gene_type:complete
MFDELGLDLKGAISGTNSKEEEEKRAKSELESAERELARAKKAL